MNYPLLAGFRENVFGRGFIASVAISGRALAVQEDERTWWIYGVNPGAIAASGSTLLEAHASLLRTFRSYLADVAQEAKNFEEFRLEVERFFEQCDADTLREWEEAHAAVRAGQVTFDQLPRVAITGKLPLKVLIAEIRPSPDQNAIEEAAPRMAA